MQNYQRKNVCSKILFKEIKNKPHQAEEISLRSHLFFFRFKHFTEMVINVSRLFWLSKKGLFLKKTFNHGK